MRVIALMCAGVLAVVTSGSAQGQSPQQLFEAGQYDAALREIAQQRAHDAGPAVTYLAGQIHLKNNQDDAARNEFQSLATSGDRAWTLIGQSALAVLAGDNQRALETATQATDAAPESFQAFYQLGQAKARFDDWAGSAEAFHRAAELDPDFAYAHYYAGLSYSRAKRVDRTSEHMERFLKLAPRAPERAAVETLMRTLRGR